MILVEAIGLPQEKLCTYCWTGEDIAKPNGVRTAVRECPSQCAAGAVASAQ
jgi:hypothetical protein